ncbi:sugar ABC transporter ATP-binding protein [Kumtagia ephedrae]|uniref:Sugar ABC transporter ATP-binding protein n=1 Tax=Kumtagia ephedrae TaxID=2116701 RepID=A0A2P7SJH7_9HYPH|nr:sugar ABC transporter ATP-binding protein [Mesorhizobium ephedrae]PSJ62646.1 sugar ABC transporter ATP-binding protein [Mesorhizobium ephedrae]
MLEVTGFTKAFQGVVALDNVDFSLERGEVHALLGENGAGKSTLINLIAGTFPWTEGSCRIGGRPVASLTPQAARENGIAAVFQEFSLVPDLTVLDNLFLGREQSGGFFLKRRQMRQAAVDLLDDLGFHVPLDEKVAFLSRAQKQMVEIAKALRTRPEVLILDEPTASLTDGEAEKLFSAMAVLKGRGVGIIYVSHRMAEIRKLSDRVTVLRGGKKIGTVATAEISDDDLIEMMVGRPVEQLFPKIEQKPGEVRLEVRNLTTADGSVIDASFVARAGEVVGLAGLVGCGRSELCRAVFGLEAVESGTIRLGDKVVERPSPPAMLAANLCYFPADRGSEGLAVMRPARENATMSALRLPSLAAGPVLKFWRENEVIRAPLTELALRPMAPERRVSAFSGGNQQKVMLARGLMKPFDVYLFDEPTVGIDVGAKADVYNLIKRLVEGGACVVVSTSELPELVNLASRIYVMHEGRVVAELGENERSEQQILSHYFGGKA